MGSLHYPCLKMHSTVHRSGECDTDSLPCSPFHLGIPLSCNHVSWSLTQFGMHAPLTLAWHACHNFVEHVYLPGPHSSACFPILSAMSVTALFQHVCIRGTYDLIRPPMLPMPGSCYLTCSPMLPDALQLTAELWLHLAVYVQPGMPACQFHTSSANSHTLPMVALYL